jgi:hypothetical protein
MQVLHKTSMFFLSTIPCTIQKKDELIPNTKFYSQFHKLNKEQRAIYDDCMYRKRMYLNQPIHCSSHEEQVLVKHSHSFSYKAC